MPLPSLRRLLPRATRYVREGRGVHGLLMVFLVCAAAVAHAAEPNAKLAPQTRKTALRFGLVDTTRPAFPVVLRRADNPHGDLTLACEACHTPTGWTPLRETPDFSHDHQTAFPLTGRHEQTTCRSCHLNLRFDQPDVAAGDCASCHLDVHRATLGTDCQRCHTTQDFGTVRANDVHARTSFPLTGAHLQVSCEACHADAGRDADGAFAPVDPTCMACHAADYAATASSLVDHEAAGFPTTCETCHSTLSFRTTGTFDHASVSGFPLLGAHNILSCASCHAVPGLEPIFLPSGPDDCVTCHEDDHAAAHPSFPTTCASCHSMNTFEGATFDHAAQTGFPLVGAHRALDCANCHRLPDFEPVFEPTSAEDCATCHADDHQAAHPAFPTTCTTCHGSTSWAASAFDHGAVTGFPLTGVHQPLECESCHTLPGFEPIFDPADASDCATCHAEDHQTAHPSFPTTCATCHQPNTWAGASFDHAGQTGFPLVGIHQSVACASCHTGPEYTPIYDPADANDCLTCHETDHQAAHPTFPTTCTTCHQSTTWAGGQFDHIAQTGFPLVGAHQALACSSCHTGPEYTPIFEPSSAEDCLTCHEDDHAAAHPAFPTTCTTCHGTQSWAGASFDHAAQTGFPLVGVHQSVACQRCHTLPDFEPIYTPADANDCATCHEDDHQAAHPTFPTTCTTCHQPNTWAGASFDHGAVTGFPLVGVHAPLGCASCHTLPDYTPIYTPANANDCYACHQTDHQAAHPTFPQTCTTCHQSTTWAGATFNHTSTGFPLVGAHTSLQCTSCHTLPDYTPIYNPANQNDCYACHQDDYQAEHAGTGFPTTCLSCHNTIRWEGATFNHDPLFPIYSGEHRGEWDSCQDCHTTPGNYQIFSCITCHAHRRSEMDDEHEDVNGYVYQSQACFNCHPRGEDDRPDGSILDDTGADGIGPTRRAPRFRLVR